MPLSLHAAASLHAVESAYLEDGTASGPRVQYKLVYEEHKEADAGEDQM